MAKKSFNVRGTLKKKPEEPKLPKKVPLRKTSKDMSEVKERVDRMHAPDPETKSALETLLGETPTPPAPKADTIPEPPPPEPQPTPEPPPVRTQKPVSPPARTPKKPKKPAKPMKLVRVTIDTPQDVHIALKIRAIREGITLRQYILRLIDQDLN